jgi:hypothetical protein
MLLLVQAALLVVGASACSDARDGVDSLRSEAEELTETTAFCLSVTRAIAAIEAGSPVTAADAAAEVLTRAPDDIREDARLVVDTVNRARDGDRDALDEPEFQDAVDRLWSRTRELCDPTT